MDETPIELLQRLRGWDMLDTCADGAYWKQAIDKALEVARVNAKNFWWLHLPNTQRAVLPGDSE